MKIGFIGSGIMGRPMAENLLRAGHQLFVYGRRFDRLEPMLVAGALGKGTPAEVAAEADITFTVVSDTTDVEQIILGDRGLVHGAKPGHIVVDMSTVSPAATRRIAAALAERGVHMLDAPVSGGETGAKEGTLSIMVGGEAPIFDKVHPLFDILGKNVVHVGGHGAGQVVKCCNQIVVGLTFEGVAEAILLARRNGVDPVKMREALLGGFAGSRILEVHGQRMLDSNYKPGFKVKLHHKDMAIVMDNAQETATPLPGAALIAQQMNALMGAGDSELDSSALMRALERLTGENHGTASERQRARRLPRPRRLHRGRPADSELRTQLERVPEHRRGRHRAAAVLGDDRDHACVFDRCRQPLPVAQAHSHRRHGSRCRRC